MENGFQWLREEKDRQNGYACEEVYVQQWTTFGYYVDDDNDKLYSGRLHS